MISRKLIAVRYVVFAILATAVNLATQWLCFYFYHDIGELAIGMGMGTATGLISKYMLDKFWIFEDSSLHIADNVQKFAFYAITGALTTSIFWSFEASFALVSDHQAMRYVGALIGLSVGYFLKFHLDSRFVFRASL